MLVLRIKIMAPPKLPAETKASVAKEFRPSTADANVQTIIRVHPHVLELNELPQISADKRPQTVLTEKPQDSKHFYSLLKYTPYSDIAENSLKVIDIPRKKKLQFHFLPTTSKLEEQIRELNLADDDGVGYVCSEILRRRRDESKVHFFDTETQTDVLVHPHILEERDVAMISEHKETQTVATSCATRR